MRLWQANTLYYIAVGGKTITSQSLEKALEQLDPGAPPDKIAAAAEVLEPYIGKGHEQIRQGVSS